MTNKEWDEWLRRQPDIHVPPPLPWSLRFRIELAEQAKIDEDEDDA